MGVQLSGQKRRGRRSLKAAQDGARKTFKWEDQEVQELSMLVLKFAQTNRGALPRRSDVSFWAFCCEHFQGRFTARQMQDKARSIKLRFLQLTSGLAKSVKASERDTFQVWSQIMTLDQGNDAAGQPGKSSHPAAHNPPNTQIPHDQAGHTTGTNDMGGPLKGKAKAPTAGGAKGGVSGAGEACAREEEGQDTSTCSTENVTKESQYSHRENYGTNINHADHDVHTTPDVGESAHNVTLFQHIIAADLAATTKTLAQFVHYHGKVDMA